MASDSNRVSSQKGNSSAGLTAEYSILERRLELINLYNSVVGPPSLGIIHVQEDFIRNRMEPSEFLAFILVCKGLISAAEKRL